MRYSDYMRSNFVAQVDPDKCVARGACVENCNANVLKLGNKLKENWRKRIMVSEAGTSPCKTKCPAHISIQGYIKKASQGKYDEALR